MKQRILKFGALLLALATGGLLVVASGIVPIAASSGHWAITEGFLSFAMRRSVVTHSLLLKAPALDAGLVLKGAGHYEGGCRSCHGAPGRAQSPIARRMVPLPPDLAKRAARRTPEQLFYVVKHGVKFTGMPAWPSPHRDDEVWAVVAFLLELPGLDAEGYRRLVHGQAPPAGARPAARSQDVAAESAQACARCHGIDGQGRGTGVFPKLAGQRGDYLRNALEAYARGTRHSGIMEPVAAGMSAKEIRSASGYYAGLRPAAAAAVPETEAVARGRTIAERGIPKRRVPACVKCHGPGGEPVKAAYPSLAGQSADYLEAQLRLFKEDRRGGSEYAHIMQPLAARLTPEEMRDVALFFAGLTF